MELRRGVWPAGSAAGKSRVRFWAPVCLTPKPVFFSVWVEVRGREASGGWTYGVLRVGKGEVCGKALSRAEPQAVAAQAVLPSGSLHPAQASKNKPQLPILGKGRDHSLPSAFYSHQNSSPGQIPDILLAKGTWAYFLSPLTELMPHPANSGKTEGPNLPPQEKQATSPVSLTLTFHSQRRAPGCGFLAGSSDL